MAKRKRLTKSYLNSAKVNIALVPSLRKYRRRKTLNRWEKSAITRAENKLKGKGNLVGLTKAQSKRIDKDLLIGNGVRAVASNVAEPGDRITINSKGGLRVKRGKRSYNFIPASPEIDQLITAAERAFAKPGTKQVFIYNSRGRSGEGARDMETFVNQITAWFQQYTNIEDWILGVVELAEG